MGKAGSGEEGTYEANIDEDAEQIVGEAAEKTATEEEKQERTRRKKKSFSNSQTASPLGSLNNFYFKTLSNFLGSLHDHSFFLRFLKKVQNGHSYT